LPITVYKVERKGKKVKRKKRPKSKITRYDIKGPKVKRKEK